MAKAQRIGILVMLMALLAVSGTAIFAQTETVTPVPPPNFTDGRINDHTNLGGLAIYCVNASSQPVHSYENGAVTIWGIGDQKYVNLSAAQLAGSAEIPQTPSSMEIQMTQTAPALMQSTPMMTEESAAMVDVTPNAMGETPVLLARATTPDGEIGFFKLGDDQFVLQGHDDNGQFFSYRWNGCTEGALDTTVEPYLPELTAAATVEFPAFETPEVTPEMTAGS